MVVIYKIFPDSKIKSGGLMTTTLYFFNFKRINMNNDLNELLIDMESIHTLNEELTQLVFSRTNKTNYQNQLKTHKCDDIALEDIKSQYGLDTTLTRKDTINLLSISLEEESKAKSILFRILEKITDIVKRFIVYNKILLAKLNNELSNGSFSKQFKIDKNKYEQLIAAFYKKSDLMDTLQGLMKIDYQDSVRSAETFEESIATKIIEAAKSIGYVIEGNNIEREESIHSNTPLIKLGWEYNDLIDAASKTVSILNNNIISGKRAVKKFKSIIKSLDSDEDIEFARAKLANVQKLILLVESISMNIAKRLITISTLLDKCKLVESE